MEQTKNLCAQIPLSLHNQVRVGQAESGQTLSEYITEILTTYYEGGFTTMANTRTLAFQISEDLYQKIKSHLQQESQRLGRKVSQLVHASVSKDAEAFLFHGKEFLQCN